jgi:hypothetical protein
MLSNYLVQEIRKSLRWAQEDMQELREKLNSIREVSAGAMSLDRKCSALRSC